MEYSETDILLPLQIGTIVKGIVNYISKQYSIVRVDKQKCILPTSEMSWSEKTRCIVNMNEEIEAVVVKIEGNMIMLSMKRLTQALWYNIKPRYKVGDRLNVLVINVTGTGAFVEIEHGLKGFIHKKQLSRTEVTDPMSIIHIGDKVDAEIIKIESERQRILLSRLHCK